ncbi:MAG: hypothetical protein GTO67_03510 [Gammaproteobacteria bacterium]|nr:hypothetical protein [Gammaproteobacteria bacterium]NIN37795.1 hypothetical protein [Gammaproteobacteria bacterium]NIO23455.1 hypothetical protein [Gammaproteobacteria bacterium]NIO64071.1 hypothetical protein [Gammaproteobacteria bacterium]NIP47066.1 hypothetical protein [Gammaproteobacteria bacterium]
MSFSSLMITGEPVSSALIWFVALTVLLYIARTPAHQAISSICRVMHTALRLSARSVANAERRLSIRNREVLLGQGREAAERIIEREIERMDATVRRDLAEYPSLHRKISEVLAAVEAEYKESAEVPPSPLSWTKAVEAVAKIPAKSDPMVIDILEEINKSMQKAHEKALIEYRKASATRHSLLKGLMPHWRGVQRKLEEVDKHVTSLLERSQIIGQHINEYRDVLNQTDRAVRILSSSALSQFFVSAFVLAVAVGGAAINFTLIARPMAEMVGGQYLTAGFKTADIAALVIILVEISMGLFLMESLRITRLFPVIGALKDAARIRMVWITFGLLFALASVEAGLAFMREMLLEDELATSALLRGDDVGATVAEFAWITTAAQMGMGFILPFALVFVAIPLETFVHSTRTVLGLLGSVVLRSLAYVLRLLGNVFLQLGSMLRGFYDLLAFVPLWIEHIVRSRSNNGRKHKAATTGDSDLDDLMREDVAGGTVAMRESY